MAILHKPNCRSILLAGLIVLVLAPAGCRQAASVPPGGSFGAFGSASPVPSGQAPSASTFPSIGSTTRVTPPSSASLGAPGVSQPGFGQPGFGQPGFGQPGFGQPGTPGNYLAPSPVGTFQANPGIPASSPLPTTNTFGAVNGNQINLSQYGSVPMGNAIARARAAAPVAAAVPPNNQVRNLPSTQPFVQSNPAPIGSGVQQTGFVSDGSLQWRNPAN